MSAAAALGIGQWHALHDSAVFLDAMVAGLYLIGPVWAMVAVGMVLVAAVPHARGIAWAPVIWALIVGLLSEPLRLPSWAKQLSALELVGHVPAEPGNTAAALILGASTVALMIVGGTQFVRRNLLFG
ncbi:MAG: hypothetical protein Q4D79_09470 [Propionibacteriaceae bacterium]|nr:hypothetical protein [Propionibacteriaceae bacterium]